MYPEISLLIDGRWTAGSGQETRPVLNPATGEEIGRFPIADPSDIDAAAAAADRAFAGWAAMPAQGRSGILRQVATYLRRDAEQLARLLTLEQGKPLAESRIEMLVAAETFEWMAEEGRRTYGRIVPPRIPGTEQFVLREPSGPVAAFAPWNVPVILSGRKIAGALAAGCTLVLKPAEETPGSVFRLVELCIEAGVPAGVINLLYGNPPEISDRLIRNPVMKKVSFTGSVPVGKSLAALAGQHMKKISLELGGHAPVIVMPDADPAHVAQAAVVARFRNAGQICFSPTRFIIHEDVHKRFVEAMADSASALVVGDGSDPSTQMGPVVDERRVKVMERLTDDAKRHGARVVTGGFRPERNQSGGAFWAPTILDDVPGTAQIMTEEPFGPIAPITSFTDLADALRTANATSFGLGAYAFTRDADVTRRLRNGLEAGMVSINTFALGFIEMPFGGVKDSGYGLEGGTEGILEFMNTKSVITAAGV